MFMLIYRLHAVTIWPIFFPKGYQVFQAAHYYWNRCFFRESLEDENKKLLDIIDKREDTIKKLEERARNALEISIHADNGLIPWSAHKALLLLRAKRVEKKCLCNR